MCAMSIFKTLIFCGVGRIYPGMIRTFQPVQSSAGICLVALIWYMDLPVPRSKVLSTMLLSLAQKRQYTASPQSELTLTIEPSRDATRSLTLGSGCSRWASTCPGSNSENSGLTSVLSVISLANSRPTAMHSHSLAVRKHCATASVSLVVVRSTPLLRKVSQTPVCFNFDFTASRLARLRSAHAVLEEFMI